MDKRRWEGILGICVFSKLCHFLMTLSSSQLGGSVLGGTGKNWGSTGKDWESLGQHWEGLGNIGLNGLCPGSHWINTGKNWGVLGTVESAQGSPGKP